MSLPAREIPWSPVRGTLALLCEREPHHVAAVLPALPALPACGTAIISRHIDVSLCRSPLLPATAVGVPLQTPTQG